MHHLHHHPVAVLGRVLLGVADGGPGVGHEHVVERGTVNAHALDRHPELGVPIKAVNVSRPTLDDVFMSYTGTTIRDAEEDAGKNRNRMMMQMMHGGRR